MGHADRVEVVWFVLAIVVCALLMWAGFRMEPHWVSKDGRRFLCTARRLGPAGEPQSRWRETRVTINSARQVQVDEKRLMRRATSFWKVVSRSETPPRNREVFLLSGFDRVGAPATLALRLPKNSRAVPALADLLGR